ncbi:hypothetical protein [Bradyrhizobium sp. UFLA05-112]
MGPSARRIVAVIESTVGVVEDLQAIAGKAMPEIALLEVPDLETRDGPPEILGRDIAFGAIDRAG